MITSFKEEAQIVSFQSLYSPDPWTLGQYEKLLGPTRNFLAWMRNSVIISTVTPLVSTVVAALAAYSLVRLNWKGSRFLSSAVFAASIFHFGEATIADAHRALADAGVPMRRPLS